MTPCNQMKDALELKKSTKIIPVYLWVICMNIMILSKKGIEFILKKKRPILG